MRKRVENSTPTQPAAGEVVARCAHVKDVYDCHVRLLVFDGDNHWLFLCDACETTYRKHGRKTLKETVAAYGRWPADAPPITYVEPS